MKEQIKRLLVIQRSFFIGVWTSPVLLVFLYENGIFQNNDSIVTSLLNQDEYIRRKGEMYLEENYNGSLPKFVAAFMNKKKLGRAEIEELSRMIEEYKEE